MKLALVVPGGVDRSGVYRVIPALLALIRELAGQHELHVFALLQEPDPARWEYANAQILNIGVRHTRIRALSAIRSEHRRSRFHFVQAFWSGAGGQVAIAAAKSLGLPCAIHVAGGELVALRAISYGGRLHWYGRLAQALVLRMANVVTAASQPMVADLAELGIKATRVPLGIDHSVWPMRAPVRRQSLVHAQLLHVASLNRVKDQATLMKAMARLVEYGIDFQLDVVGEDTLGGEIQALVRQLALDDHVRFHGFLTQQELRPLMEAADVLVVSSLHEAGPIVVLEAAAVGVPVVGTSVGHIREWAPHAALAVPTGDATALADGVRQLLVNEDYRLGMAQQASLLASTLDSRNTASQLMRLYREHIRL